MNVAYVNTCRSKKKKAFLTTLMIGKIDKKNE